MDSLSLFNPFAEMEVSLITENKGITSETTSTNRLEGRNCENCNPDVYNPMC